MPPLQSPHFPQRTILRSSAQAQKLSIKRVAPRSVEFQMKETLPKPLFRKIAKTLAKYSPKLRNPPLREVLAHSGLMKNCRALKTLPEKVLSHMKKISTRCTRLRLFSICSDKDSFAPMNMKGRILPIRSLRTFCHEHELCKGFMACASYTRLMKIKKSSLNIEGLKKFRHLETLHIIFKAKYMHRLEDERKLVLDLAATINAHLPSLRRVILEHEIGPDGSPFSPLQLAELLNPQVEVDLVADLVDVSSCMNPQNNIERIFSEILASRIRNININYAGIIKSIKKCGRWFYVPIHLRKDLYIRFLRSVQQSSFDKIHFAPHIHSAHFNSELRDALKGVILARPRVNVPKLTITYCLDTIAEEMFDLCLDLFTDATPAYEVVVTSTVDLTHEQCEVLEKHYSKVVMKVKDFDVDFSMSVTARTHKSLAALLQIIIPRSNIFLLKELSLKVINPVNKANFKSLTKLIGKTLANNCVNRLDLNVTYKEKLSAQDIYDGISFILQRVTKLQRLTLLHQNSDEWEDIIGEAFARLRRDRFGIDLKFEVDRDRGMLECV